MQMDDMILVSIDDHSIEPPTMYEHHVPARLRDQAPRVVRNAEGIDQWGFQGEATSTPFGMAATVGWPAEEWGRDAGTYSELRPGCFDLNARLDDMGPGRHHDRGRRPYDFDIDTNPYPVWKRMRDEAPLYYNERYNSYSLSRYADVEQASTDWKTYTSAKGIGLTDQEILNYVGQLYAAGNETTARPARRRCPGSRPAHRRRRRAHGRTALGDRRGPAARRGTDGELGTPPSTRSHTPSTCARPERPSVRSSGRAASSP
jgi:hypothetical protein